MTISNIGIRNKAQISNKRSNFHIPVEDVFNNDDMKVLEQRFSRAGDSDTLEFFKELMDAYKFASVLRH